MQFFEVVEFLGAQLQLPQLVPTPQGRCAVRFDDVVVAFVHDPTAQSFDIQSELGVADVSTDTALTDLLAANRHGDASMLGCDASGAVTLRQRFSLQDLSLPRLWRALERFVNRAEDWQQRLQAAPSLSDRAAAPTAVFA